MSILSEDNLDAYTITFRREIIFYLRQLVNEATPITVMFHEGEQSLLTVLLEVDEANNRLIFDWGGSEETNQRFLRSERNYFLASPHGVRNQFLTGRAEAIQYQGNKAFAAPLPEKYVRLQRREFFRLQLPLTQRPQLRFNLGGRSLTLEVTDISVGGVALEATQLPPELETGLVLNHCHIPLGSQMITTDIEIRHIEHLSRGSRDVIHLGCQFKRLSGAQENEVQRFMTQIQRDERARLGR